MKKWMAVLLVLAAILLVGAASADNYPVNPYAAEALSPTYYAPEESELTVELTGPETVMVRRGAEWRFSVSGGEAPYSYQYYILNPDWETNSYRHWSERDTFTFDFVEAGDYILLANVRDSAGSIASVKLEISVATAPVTTYATTEQQVAAKVAQVVDECFRNVNRNDEYAVALWLHDWLTHNAYYDYTYTYYGADGVLLRGTGVCQSYAMAYVALMEKAGIRCTYQRGYVYGDPESTHRWNLAWIEGAWYNIDPTWDDPGDATTPVSGYEGHDYFCVSDEMLAVDHNWKKQVSCVSLACNYEIREGELQRRLDVNGQYADRGWPANAFYSYAQIEQLLNNAASFPCKLDANRKVLWEPDSNDAGFLTGKWADGFRGYLIAYLLQQRQWTYKDIPVYYNVQYDYRTGAMSFDFDYSRIYIPEALVTGKNTITQGQAVTYTLQHIGNDPIEGMEYHVYDRYGRHISGWTGISESYTFTPGAVGTYTVRVYLKAKHGVWMSVDSAPLTVTAPSNALKVTELTPNATSVKLGEQLTFTTKTAGSSEITFMEYHIYNEYGQHITGYTGLSDHYSFTPTEAGKYTARVYMRTNHSGDNDLICDSAVVTVDGGTRKVSTLKCNTMTAKVGDTLTFTATLKGSGAIAWIEYHLYNKAGAHLTGYRGEGSAISSVYYCDTKNLPAGVYKARVYLMAADGTFTQADSFDVILSEANTKSGGGTVVGQADGENEAPAGEPTQEPGEEPAEEPTVEPAEEPTAEPEEEIAGSSFETAIEAGRSIRAELETATYYRVKLAEGTYTFTLRDTVTEAGDGAELAVYSKSQSSLMKLRTTEGEAVGQLTVPGGEYYLVLSGAGVELLIEEFAEIAEDPAEESAEEPAAEPADEAGEETADEADAEEAVAEAVEVPAELSETESDAEAIAAPEEEAPAEPEAA